ncbi:MAG TPA: hypothetical protein VFG58_07870, partial [Solirubrobacterales bacterium]|nr:hypothetical protein [Solirubrobacterales bacterium]
IFSNEVDNGTTGGSVAVMSCADSGQPGFGSCSSVDPDVVKVVTIDAGATGVSAQPFYVAVTG